MKEEPINKLIHFIESGQKSKLVEKDVFFEKAGKKYKRFYQGQELPIDIWNYHFSQLEEILPETIELSEVIEEEVPLLIEEVLEKPAESIKPKRKYKKRAKK